MPTPTIQSFQKHISDRYEKVDRQRGWPKTFAYFIEEVGELATAARLAMTVPISKKNSPIVWPGSARWRTSAMSIWRRP